MRALALAVSIGFAVAAFAAPASAAPILATGSTWEYTFADPTGDASWNTTTGGWDTGPAPFGNNTGGYPSDPAGDFDYATLWPADGSDGNDLWVRTTFDTTGFDLDSISWNLGVDNGYALYLNGDLIASANGEGYTYQWEYSGDFGTSLVAGTNVLAVALEDHGGLTAFDMEVVGTPIPEPTTLLLFGSGLATAVVRFRRGRR
jgi:hypothetical protein